MKSQAIRDLIFELIAKGRSKIEIADILGVKRNTIYRWLRVGNVRLQKRGPRYRKRSMSEEQEQALVQKIMSNSSMAQADLKRHVNELRSKFLVDGAGAATFCMWVPNWKCCCAYKNSSTVLAYIKRFSCSSLVRNAFHQAILLLQKHASNRISGC